MGRSRLKVPQMPPGAVCEESDESQAKLMEIPYQRPRKLKESTYVVVWTIVTKGCGCDLLLWRRREPHSMVLKD